MDTLQGCVAHHAAREPRSPAILAVGLPPLSYAELRGRIDDAIEGLRSLGVTARDRVAVVLPEGPDGAILIIAVSAIASCAPLNPRYSGREFEQQLITSTTLSLAA